MSAKQPTTHQVVKRGEVYRRGHGTLHEVHGQPLVEAAHHTLRPANTVLRSIRATYEAAEASYLYTATKVPMAVLYLSPLPSW